jgi:formate-dependent nitrite reductase cytochrome c552 subunit
MNKLALIILMLVLACTGTAIAQGFTIANDVLGAHNVNGRGCIACHAPHSGAQGNGGSDASSGQVILWGRDFINQTYTTEAGNTFTTPANTAGFTNRTGATALTDKLYRTAVCLSCHDGAVTVQGMTGHTVETIDGVNTAPTWLNSGFSLTNSHPVDIPYLPDSATIGGTTIATHWPGTVTNGRITWDTTNALANNFNNVYGHPASLVAATDGQPYIECTTCHDHHSMSVARVRIPSTSTTRRLVKTRFFVKGWYDSLNPASNSATQFCRSCHADKSNEAYGVNSVTF